MVKKFTSPTHPTKDDCKMNKEAGHSQSVASRKVHIIQDTDAKSMQSLGPCIGTKQHFTDKAERVSPHECCPGSVKHSINKGLFKLVQS